ncbi:arylmalonate decarboxylase, partial [Streptomyces aureus]
MTTGASSCRAALNTLGCRRIAVVCPYQPVADREVGRHFAEAGFDVAAISGLRCPTAMDIARVGPERIRDMVASLDDPSVDAIVQVGTNLSFVAQADA